jgi:hypothetical protein
LGGVSGKGQGAQKFLECPVQRIPMTKLNSKLHETNYQKQKVKEKKNMSHQSLKLLEERGKALQEPAVEKFEKLDKEFRKSRKKDRTNYVLRTLSQELDIRDRWMGIRALKQEFIPQPYHAKDKLGKSVPVHQQAEEAARYLEEEQWGENKHANAHFNTQKVISENLTFNLNEISLAEIKSVLKKCKRRKAPGPDEIPMEIFLEMTDENLEEVKTILNLWWNKECVPTEVLQARVVLIYQKGDTSRLENYRPISLLNSTKFSPQSCKYALQTLWTHTYSVHNTDFAEKRAQQTQFMSSEESPNMEK